MKSIFVGLVLAVATLSVNAGGMSGAGGPQIPICTDGLTPVWVCTAPGKCSWQCVYVPLRVASRAMPALHRSNEIFHG